MNDLYRLADTACKASAAFSLILRAMEMGDLEGARYYAEQGRREAHATHVAAHREISEFEKTAPPQEAEAEAEAECTNIAPGPLARLDKEFAVSYFVNGPHEVTVW